MANKEMEPDAPASPRPAGDRFSHIEKFVRWAFWIAIAGAIAWVFVDLLIQH